MVRLRTVTLDRRAAERLLAANDLNRPARPNAITRWRGIFERGEYDADSGETIKVRGTWDRPDRLQDGQHRVLGFLAAEDDAPGNKVTVSLAEGVPDTAQDVLDTGMKRTLADRLRALGEHQAKQLASVTTLSLKVALGHPGSTSGVLTHVQLLAHLEATPHLRDGITAGRKMAEEFHVSPTGCCYAVAEVMQAGGPATADDFLIPALSGASLAKDHPILHLRKKLVGWGALSHEGQAGPLAYVVAATIIKTWNLWRENSLAVNLHAIEWPAVSGEPFPVAR